MTGDELSAVARACQQVGLDPDGALLLRYHVNRAYHLPRAGVVARVSPASRLNLAWRGIEVTRWLISKGFPSTAPLDVEQPLQVDEHVVTFWRYYDQTGRPLPPSRVLAETLRRLHACGPPPLRLPTYQPLDSVGVRSSPKGPNVVDSQQYEFLQRRAPELLKSYGQLTSVLGEGHPR
jgi:hypothetical protein